MNRSNVIIGIDPDLRDCGIAVYDVKTNTVVETQTLRPYKAIPALLEYYMSYGSRAIFRLEMPDQKSAYGASKAGKSRKVHSVAFLSGEASGVAKMVLQELEIAGAYVEQVPGSLRWNLSTPKAKSKEVLSMPLSNQLSWMKRHPMSKPPSKANAELALAVFPTLAHCKYNNDAVRDALFLACLERYFFHKS